MKNFFKRTVVFISSIVFCFTPLLFAGCDLSFSDNGYGDMQSDFNVNHYLTGLKVAYSANFNPNTTDEKLIKLKNEILANNLLIAKDIMVNLLSVYGTGINEEFSIVQKDLLNPLNVLATINYTQEDESVNNSRNWRDSKVATTFAKRLDEEKVYVNKKYNIKEEDE